METESKQNDGQTATITAAADYSKLNFMNDLEEVFLVQPSDCFGCLKELACGLLCSACPFPIGEIWDVLTCICSCEDENVFEVRPINQKKEEDEETVPLFNLKEESNICARKCCSLSTRPLMLNALLPGDDGDGTSLFRINKPYRMRCCCFSPESGCIGGSITEVYVGDCMIGSVQKNAKLCCCCQKSYSVYENGKLLTKIERFSCDCCSDNPVLEFEIGNTGKKISGRSIDYEYGIVVEFPKSMRTLQQKILLIAAAMMIAFNESG